MNPDTLWIQALLCLIVSNQETGRWSIVFSILAIVLGLGAIFGYIRDDRQKSRR